MKRKYLFSKLAVTILLVTSATQIKSDVGAEVSSTSQFESTLITKNSNMIVYDGNKLKLGNTKDTTIFEDDFSDENMEKWDEHTGVHIDKEGDKYVAVFPTDSNALLKLPVEDTPGVHRLSFDIKYDDYYDERDVLKINIANNDAILSMGIIPVKVGEWAHIEYIVADNFTQDYPQSYFEVLAPKSKEASNTDVKVSIRNINFSNINPTINEEFTTGKIDEKISTNDDFKYEIQKNNTLRVTMPSDKLCIGSVSGEFDRSSYASILKTKETLSPTIYDPFYGVKQEGALFLVGIASGENQYINSQLITAVTLSIESQNQLNHVRFNNSILPSKGSIGVIPADFPLANISLDDEAEVDYGIGVAKASEELKEDGAVYIDYFKAYKGLVNVNTLSPSSVTKVMRIK